MYELAIDLSDEVWMIPRGKLAFMRIILLSKLPRYLSDGQLHHMEVVVKKMVDKINKLYPLDEPLSMQVRDRKNINGSLAIYIFRKGCKKVTEKFFARLNYAKSNRQLKDALIDDILEYSESLYLRIS